MIVRPRSSSWLESPKLKGAVGLGIVELLDHQNYDTPDPLQSGLGCDEKAEISEHLEASLDRGILAGLFHVQRVPPRLSTAAG